MGAVCCFAAGALEFALIWLTVIEVMTNDEDFPRLASLKPRERKFVWEYLRNRGNASAAAKEAGYAENAKHPHYIRVQGHRMLHRKKIAEAIDEVAKRHFGNLLVPAVSAAEAIISNPKHPQHAAVVLSMLSRLGLTERTEHTMTVEHKDLGRAEMLARIGQLARELELDPARLLGVNAVPMRVINDEKNTGAVDSTSASPVGIYGAEPGGSEPETTIVQQVTGSQSKKETLRPGPSDIETDQ
jgi:hypothetical protein